MNWMRFWQLILTGSFPTLELRSQMCTSDLRLRRLSNSAVIDLNKAHAARWAFFTNLYFSLTDSLQAIPQAQPKLLVLLYVRSDHACEPEWESYGHDESRKNILC